MRRYELIISNADGQVLQPSPTGGFTLGTGTTFASLDANGVNIPGALNVEFDFPIVQYNAFQGGQVIRIWGIGLAMIGQAHNLSGMNFRLSAGMTTGLPLANPSQYGVIAQGQIFQAFGNWQGTNQSLDLICNPGTLAPSGGISWNWPIGQSLGVALTAALVPAFPKFNININISQNLSPPNGQTQSGSYGSLMEFAEHLVDITQPLGAQITNNYPGVSISINGATMNISDATVAPSTQPKQLNFQDLIGQPTWMSATTISVKTVLRGDLSVGSQFLFPQNIVPAYALTTAAAAVPNAPSSAQSVFQGAFTIVEMHHFANFRQADANSWNTTFVGTPVLS